MTAKAGGLIYPRFMGRLDLYGRSHRQGSPTAAVALLPAAVGSVGVGAVAAKSPIAGAGAGILTGLALLPWSTLFLLLAAAAAVNERFKFVGVDLQPAHIFVLPLAAKAAVQGWGSRLRWSGPEWCLAAFLGGHLLSSILMAADPGESLTDAALLGLGVLAYFATSASINTPTRLVFAGRTLLLVAIAASAVALAAITAHIFLGTRFGVSGSSPSTGVAAVGLAREHNILGSFSAAAALSFLVLSRFPNPLFSRRFAVWGFLMCATAMVTSLTRGAQIAFAISALLLFAAPSTKRATRTGKAAASLRLAATLSVVAFVFLVMPSAAEYPPPGPGASLPARAGYQAVHILDPGSQTAETRLAEWRIALDDARSSPWIGLGTNSYGQRHLGARSGDPGYIGGLYVRTLHDTGLLGIVFLLTFLVTLLWPGRLLRASAGIALVTLALVVGGIVTALSYMWTDATFQIWPWILFGVVRAGRHLMHTRSDGSRGRVRISDDRV